MERIQKLFADIVSRTGAKSPIEMQRYQSDFLKILEDFSEMLSKASRTLLIEKKRDETNILALLRVRESYEVQVSRFRSLGWLVKEDNKEGMIGLDKKFYPLPLLEEIEEEILAQADLFAYKYAQGYKKCLLVLFGKSCIDIYTKLQLEQRRYAKDPHLQLYWKNERYCYRITKMKKSPYFCDDMKMEAELLYYPETLYSNDPKKHQAKNKRDLITKSRFPGWEVHLVLETPLLARYGKGETIGDRPVFEGKNHFGDYLDIMKGRVGTLERRLQPIIDVEGQNIYRGEVGLTPETWAAWAFEELYTHNQVIHNLFSDHNERYISDIQKGTAPVLLGVMTKERVVPVSCFRLDNENRVQLYGMYPDHSNDYYVGASSVKVC